MLSKFQARAIKAFGLVLVLSQFVVSPANGATIVQKTPLTIINTFEKNFKTVPSITSQGTLQTILMPEDETSSYDLLGSSLSSKKIIATFKAARLALIKPLKYVKEESINGSRIYNLGGRLTQAGAYNAVQSFYSLVNAGDLSAREYNSLKSAKKYFSNGEIKMSFDAIKMAPTKVVLTWTTLDPKYKNKVVNTLTINFSYVAPVVSNLTAKSAEVAVNTSSANAKSANNSSVTVSGPILKQVDSSGQGGVVSAYSGDLDSALGRDIQRLNDLKAIQTALELYYADQAEYPRYSNLILGTGTAVCLNSDGFMSADMCPYPYMLKVPMDPKNFSYVYTGDGRNYFVAAKLEGTVRGYKGNIKLTNAGITQE